MVRYNNIIVVITRRVVIIIARLINEPRENYNTESFVDLINDRSSNHRDNEYNNNTAPTDGRTGHVQMLLRRLHTNCASREH